ncbi:MAG: alpha/beta hydrolase [Pseudomonadota bacterium]
MTATPMPREKLRGKRHIVMIHGAFCGGWAFNQYKVPFIEAGYEVHTPTLRHHEKGWPRRKPAKELATTSTLDYLADLKHYLQRFEEPPILIGHSMGGLLTQMLAASRIGRAAVLMAPSAPHGVLPFSPFDMIQANALFMEGRFWEKVIVPVFHIVATHVLNCVDPYHHHRLFRSFVPESGRATFEIFQWALDPQQATVVQTRNISIPIMTIAGEKDLINPAGMVRQLAFRYRQREHLHVYSGNGHWLIEEPGWEGIAEDTINWLEVHAA